MPLPDYEVGAFLLCAIEDCEQPASSGSRGWCSMHYQRWCKHGTASWQPIVLTPMERFFDKVSITESCWLWTGALNSKGYGNFGVNGKTWQAHRFAYINLVGPIPDDLHTDHLCRVTRCVNPDHLEPVTRKVNAQRGRGGEWQRIKTHCPQGHEYTEENTYRFRGGRQCQTCRNVQREESRLRCLARA